MEIGPIPGIRAVQPVQAKRTGSDLSGVFRVEFQREQQERYTPHGQSSERGIEDEDDGIAAQDEITDGEPARAASPEEGGERQINFFA